MQTNLRIAVLLVCSLFFNGTSAQTPNWKNIGPISFPKKTVDQIQGIGRCIQIKFHPSDPNKMYVASASGGLYQSNDKGLHWTSLGTDQVANTTSSSIAIDPTNDQVIYWGTGDANNSYDGLGVYKTINGGTTWTVSNSGMGNRLVIHLLILPTDHNTIIAATSNGIYKSTDAGANWSLKSVPRIEVQDMCYKPGTNGQVIYATASKNFYRSLDAGNSWTEITSPAFVFGANGTRVSVCEADPNVVYVANVGANTIGEIYKSTDGGSTFTNMRSTKECLAAYSASGGGGQGDYNFDFEVNPANSNELYVCAHLIWRSTDAGVTWVQQQKSWSSDLHTDQHHIVFDPYVSGQLWNANDGGVWSNTANGTGEWTPKSDGIAATEIYHGAISKTNRNLLYIGTQDNGGIYYNNSTFYNNRGGDFGPFMWFDYSGNFYSESDGSRHIYPSDSDINLNLPETPSGGKFTFTAVNADIAYHANAGKIYRCINLTSASPSWTLIYTIPSGKVKDLQVDPSNADRLYVFTDSPALYRSDNAMTAASFVQITLPVQSTNGSVAPIPNSDVVYLGLGNTIYRSADKGTTWTTTKGFPAAKVLKVVADYKSTNEAVYASYPLGVYYKDNTKSSWINYSSGLPIISEIVDMDIYNDGISKGILNAYFYGRGAWQSDLVPPPSNITVAMTSPANNTTFSSPATINLQTTASVSSGNISKVEFYNSTTLLGTSLSSPYVYSWNGVLPGNYDLTAVAYDNLGNKKSSALVTVTVTFVCNKVSGTPFGTSPYVAGSEYDKAFDGDINTNFSAKSASSGYTGLDLGTAKVVTNVRYYPRSSQAIRMKDGKFQGSNTSSSAGFVDLYTIPTEPNYAWQDVSIPNSTAYRYYRYLSPVDGYCDVAEIEFCTHNELPTINLTAPLHNELYTAIPANINITAAASDMDGSISKVEFYQGETLLGIDTSSPYSFDWTGIPSGTYQLLAKAYDNLNAVVVSSPITVVVGNQNPTVSIISPDDYAVFANPANITIYATASDADGTISKVEFYNGPSLLGTSTTNPYSYHWADVPVGTYTLTAKAYDNNGGTTDSSPITVNVPFTCSPLSGSPFGTPPYYTYATYDKAFDGDLGTTFQASTSNNGYTGLDFGTAKVVKAIRFYPRASRESRMNGGKFQGSNIADFSSGVVDLYTIPSIPVLKWNEVALSNETAFRYVRYLSPAGGYCNVAEIEFCGLNIVPKVNITAPANAATYVAPAAINIAADVNGSVSKIEFYIGASLIGTSTSSPYNYNLTGISGGTYNLTAKTYDPAGAVVSSAPVNFTVINNIAPTVSITAPADNAIYVAPATFAISATANDADGNIDKVEFYNGPALLGTANASPYTFNWNSVAAGTYTLTAKAYDNNGIVTTSSAVSVKVNQPPTVNISSPADNTIYAAPATFDISATANDTDGSIDKVEFYNGPTLLGTVNASPYTFNWNSVTAGTYTLTAKAYDNNGTITTSSAVSVRVNQPPTVSITTPKNNSNYIAPASVTINATAADTDGIVNKVEFYNGTNLIATSTATPYTCNLTSVSAGAYSLTAKACDDRGTCTTSSAIAITVNTPVNQAPSASITSPATNTVFIAPANITINAVATDSDGTISKVEFYNGATLLSSSTTSPYTYNWENVPSGTYAITVKSYDNANATATSAVVNVVVNNNQAPTVSVTSPINNTAFIAPASIIINAAATDSDGTISKVEFYNGATLLSTSTTSPYTYNWENVTAGTYQITAKSYDNANATATSAAVNVVVNNNQAPTISVTSPANNTVFITPASITINAVATDSDGTISKVEFYNGATLLSTSTTSPYTYNWENVTTGTYAITVKATDNTGNLTSSTPVNIVVKTNPIISMISPSENDQIVDNGSDVLFKFKVTDPDAVVSSIIIKDNGAVISTISKLPYSFTLTNLSSGDHYFTATAVFENGAEYTFTSLNMVSKSCKSMEWNTSTDYLIGDQVIYQNSLYRALVINKNKQPDQDKSIWSKIGTCENLSVEDFPAPKSKYILYPNPCTTHFNIKFTDCAGKSFYYSIMDINGRVIREQKSESINNIIFEKEVNIQGLSSGTYIVIIHLDEKVYSEKIIIIEKPSMYKKKR
ncbi:Ig-like domain-containing protein [Flavobacterium sp.]|uniref:Ig-like domain-containing protein n=1 Tax=Flavobacterium sp. TaxID=239 RepID=UPI0025C18140|nr:Ig-like domain-containing protein [Flavobacterium sp.]